MGHYLVERYLPAAGRDLLGDEAERLTTASAGGPRLLWALYSPEDETCFFLFDASAPALIEAAARSVGIGLDKVVSVTEVPCTVPGSGRCSG